MAGGEYVILYDIHTVTRNIVQHAEDIRPMSDFLHKWSVIVSKKVCTYLDMTTLHSFILHTARLFIPLHHLKINFFSADNGEFYIFSLEL